MNESELLSSLPASRRIGRRWSRVRHSDAESMSIAVRRSQWARHACWRLCSECTRLLIPFLMHACSAVQCRSTDWTRTFEQQPGTLSAISSLQPLECRRTDTQPRIELHARARRSQLDSTALHAPRSAAASTTVSSARVSDLTTLRAFTVALSAIHHQCRSPPLRRLSPAPRLPRVTAPHGPVRMAQARPCG